LVTFGKPGEIIFSGALLRKTGPGKEDKKKNDE
jgi:hypothetical protein